MLRRVAQTIKTRTTGQAVIFLVGVAAIVAGLVVKSRSIEQTVSLVADKDLGQLASCRAMPDETLAQISASNDCLKSALLLAHDAEWYRKMYRTQKNLEAGIAAILALALAVMWRGPAGASTPLPSQDKRQTK